MAERRGGEGEVLAEMLERLSGIRYLRKDPWGDQERKKSWGRSGHSRMDGGEED